MVDVYIGVGSNIDRQASITRALSLLKGQFGPLTCSPIYECPAVGFAGDPFFNLVVKFQSSQDVAILVRQLDCIEQECGRNRSHVTMSSRNIDLDLLMYGDLVDHSEAIRVPRKDITDYAFVLRPLAELEPNLIHPELGKTMFTLWEEFDQQHFKMREVAAREMDLAVDNQTLA